MIVFPFSIQFGESGDYRLWAGEGWLHDQNDKNHTWMPHVASIKLPFSRVTSPIRLDMDMIPVQSNGLQQEVHIYVNGGFAAFWAIDTAEKKSAVIDAYLFRPGENVITILCPRAICPADAGLSNDKRTLGVAIRSIAMSKAAE